MSLGPIDGLRPARLEDAVCLTALVAAAYAPLAAVLGSTLPAGGHYADEIARFPVWIAERCGRMVGVLVLQPQPDHMLLANVAVRPDHQGNGIGGMLLEKAEAEARVGGFREMRLFTHADTPDTVLLYERNGWVRSPSEPHGERVEMVKQLGPDRPEA